VGELGGSIPSAFNANCSGSSNTGYDVKILSL
jgi:hypothetical protein